MNGANFLKIEFIREPTAFISPVTLHLERLPLPFSGAYKSRPKKTATESNGAH